MFTFTCQLCGNEFETASNRAKYCPDCRIKAQGLRNKAYKQKRHEGTSKQLHSEQTCPICGKTYIQESGSQKCCADCRKKQESSRKIATNARYTKENYEQIILYVPIGQRDELKAYAESHGLSVNKLFMTALEEYRTNHKEETSNG
ncbi:MAG: hypothetical protein IJJ69_11805 [Oscillospiraceae bacterium]|nr:hypothetical protein [Oscillospiraceae bacterium]